MPQGLKPADSQALLWEPKLRLPLPSVSFRRLPDGTRGILFLDGILLDECAKLGVLEPDGLCGEPGNQKPAVTVQKARTQHEILNPGPRSGEPSGCAPASDAFFEETLRGERRIGVRFSRSSSRLRAV